VKNRFQSFPFKCNLQRYTKVIKLTDGNYLRTLESSIRIGGAVHVESS
jgi:hypothetical protein